MADHWTLEDLYQGIMRSWWVLVGTVLLFSLVGAGLWFVFPQTYTAQAQHTVEPISVLTPGSTFNTVSMETERLVATSTTVLERAADELDDAGVAALRNATVIQIPRGSQVLTFEVTTADPDRSADWANALAVAYGEQREDNAREVVERGSTDLEESIGRLQDVIDTQAEGSSAREASELQMQSLQEQQARLAATPFYSGMLVTPAVAPTESNRPRFIVFVAGGLFLGLMVGGIAALLVSRARRGPTLAYRRERKAAERPASDASDVRPAEEFASSPTSTGGEDADVGAPAPTDVEAEAPHRPRTARESPLAAARSADH